MNETQQGDLTVYYCPVCDYYWGGLYINDRLPKCPQCLHQINKRLANQLINLILKEGTKAIKTNPNPIELGSERDFEYV